MTASDHPDVAKYDQAVVEHEAREFCESIGYAFHMMTDGTFIMEPPADPEHEARVIRTIDALFPERQHVVRRWLLGTEPGDFRYAGVDGNQCFDCGVGLTALDRHQRVVNNPDGPTAVPAFWIRYVCPTHYANPL